MGRDLRGEYLETLTRVGRRDPRLIPVYLEALRCGEGNKQALEGLEWFDDDSIAPLLGLLNQKDIKDRARIENALMKLGRAVIPALEATLGDVDVYARRNGAKLLCRAEKVPPKAVPVFLEVLQQEDQGAWSEALSCLGRAGAALAPHADKLPKLYERMNDDGRRIEVVNAFASCGEATQPYIPFLIAAIQGSGESGDHGRQTSPKRDPRTTSQEDLRQSAINTLGRIGSSARAAVPALARFIEERGGDSSAQSAVEALRMIGPAAREAVPVLVPLLTTSDWAVQEAALSALIALGTSPEILVPKCLEFLRDEEGRLRGPALKYLTDSGYDNADFRVLLEKLSHDRRLGLEATRALRKVRPPSGGFLLIAPDLPGFVLTQWGVKVGWGQHVPGATGYRFFRREEPGGEWAMLEESGVSGFDDHGVEPGRVYGYRAEAFNADADGRPSGVLMVEIRGTQIREQHAPPTGLTVETAIVQRGDGEHRVARLNWDAPRGWDCRGYVVFSGLTGSNLFGPIGVSRSTSFVHEYDRTELRYSISYFVRGIDADFRQSEASNQGVAAAVRVTR